MNKLGNSKRHYYYVRNLEDLFKMDYKAHNKDIGMNRSAKIKEEPWRSRQ